MLALRFSAPLLLLAIAAPALPQFGDVGLSAVRARRFHNENLLVYVPEAGDRFASVLATGDFNGDGADDLATGIPFDDCLAGGNGPVDSGAVVVRYGAPGSGLHVEVADDFLNQFPGGGPDPADQSDLFGFALAACDFNGDGFDDLAVGVPGEDHLGSADAGAVQIHYGGPTGLPVAGDAFYTQSTPGIPGDVELGDQFGRALACAHFDDDEFGDLAIGVPYEGLDGDLAAGLVAIVPGSAFGLDPSSASDLELDDLGSDESPGDRFGFALAAGDFDGDGFADLAIGGPGRSATVGGGAAEMGLVGFAFGTPTGLTGNGAVLVVEAQMPGGEPIAENAGDNFGHSLAVGDFDADAFDDLVIGIPFEDFGPAISEGGQVVVIFGSAIGPLPQFAQFWTQDAVVGGGTTETGDEFGYAIAAGDFDGDGADDLAVGSPGEFVLVAQDGAITVWMGAAGIGFSSGRHRGIATGFEGFPGDANEPARRFGEALASGDFDGDGHLDLAIGAPWENENGVGDVGAETVLYGSLFSDGFGIGSTAPWSRTILGAPVRPESVPMSASARRGQSLESPEPDHPVAGRRLGETR